MSSLLRYLTTLVTGALMVILGVITFSEKFYVLTLVFLALLAVTLYVWTSKKALSYRFLYPGMLCFLLFTIAPIFFTVFISFTNLGTAHFFSEEGAREIILSEKMIPENALELSFKLYPTENGQYIIVSGDSAAIIGESKNIQFEKLSREHRQQIKEHSPLSLPQVFDLREKLEDITYIYQGRELSYHRVDLLIESSKRYRYNPKDHSITDLSTQLTYYPDQERGFYINVTENTSLLPGFYTYIGIKNYLDLFRKDDFKQTFLKVSTWTLVWAISSVILTFSLGMSLAIFLNDKNLRGKSVYRNLLILPYSIPFFISVLVFKGMLSKDYGIINSALAQVGVGPIPWLEDALWAKVSCLLVNLWLGFPYMFLLTTGILQSIPQSVYEAAKIDGASKWQSFKSITFPMILNSITPLLIGSFAFNLGNFVGIYLLTGGGPAMMGATTPAGETDILISYTYRLAFEGASGQMFGLASSIALFIFVIITLLTLINFKLFNINKTEKA